MGVVVGFLVKDNRKICREKADKRIKDTQYRNRRTQQNITE